MLAVDLVYKHAHCWFDYQRPSKQGRTTSLCNLKIRTDMTCRSTRSQLAILRLCNKELGSMQAFTIHTHCWLVTTKGPLKYGRTLLNTPQYNLKIRTERICRSTRSQLFWAIGKEGGMQALGTHVYCWLDDC